MALQPSATDSLATDDHSGTIVLVKGKHGGKLDSDMTPGMPGKM